MYCDGFGHLFHPKASTISCRDLLRHYPHVTEKNMNHGRQGKWVDRRGRCLKIKRCEGVIGQPLKRPRRDVSPETQRKQQRPDSEAVSGDLKIVEECLPDYPAWKMQKYNILSRVNCPREVEERLNAEVEKVWKEWTRDAARHYLFGRMYRSRQYDASPPWKGVLERNTSLLSQRLRISTRIVEEFHHNHRSYAFFDAAAFFAKEQSLEAFNFELKEFLRHAKQRITVKWPLAVGRIMLDEGDAWIPRVVDGSCSGDFEAVAATMSRLLYDVLLANFHTFRSVFSSTERCVIRVEVNKEGESFSLWDTVAVMKQLAVFPCVEHLLYPRHFPPKLVNISGWFSQGEDSLDASPAPLMELVTLKQALKELEAELENAQLSTESLDQWSRIYRALQGVEEKARDLQPLLRTPPVCYDRSRVKTALCGQVKLALGRAEKKLLDWQAERNRESHRIFAEWSRRLCDADVLEQLCSIGELQQQVARVKAMVADTHEVYAIAWQHFNVPDPDLRDYWEISRLPKRLTLLADCVWKRVEQEREWVGRKVAESTSSNYFEAESIERELDQALKKYRGLARPADIQRIAVKFSQLSVRCGNLLLAERELQGQRALLGLPEFTMDVQAMFKLSQFFAELAELQFRTLNHEDEVLHARVMDVDHGGIVATTERLQKAHQKLLEEAKQLEEKYDIMVEAVLARAAEGLAKVQKLIPVISTVHNQGMKERHWEEIFKEVDKGSALRGNPVVKDLLDMKIMEKAEKLKEISQLAEKEMFLEDSVNSMKAQWNLASFEVRSKGVLMSTELSTQMAAHIAKSQQILTSPYVLTILEQLRNWLDTLLQLHTFVELHSQCDRLWLRVEGVFSTEDVAYQMPSEFRTFKKISFLWQQVNSRITEDKPILEQIETIVELNKILTELQEDFAVLERGFHSYLRKKRLVFPRLHLLDDGRLLHLLSISREPAAVNQVLRHLFPHIRTLIFNKRGEIAEVDLTSGKRMKLAKVVNVPVAKRHVEKWLAELDRELKATVRLRIKSLLERHSFRLLAPGELAEEETHVAVVFCRIVLTHMVEEAMRHSSLRSLEQDLLLRIADSLKLTGPKRSSIEPLVDVLQHYLETVRDLLSRNVLFTDDIYWKKHLRMYWNLEQVFIRILDIATRHDYEISTPLAAPNCDHALGVLLTWNRFSTPLAPSNLSCSARTAASVLGRALLDVSEGQPIEAGLWMGPVAISSEEPRRWKAATRDVQNNVLGGSHKILADGGEIPTNPSLLPIFSLSGVSLSLQDKRIQDIASKLSISGFPDSERWAHMMVRVSQLVPLLFNIPALPLSIQENSCREAIGLKLQQEKSEQEAIALSLFNNLCSQIVDENWSEFLKLFSDIKAHCSTDRKEKELLRLLEVQQSVIVFGGSLCGKTRIISRAAEAAGVDLLGDAEAPTDKMAWITVDGDEEKTSWILEASHSPTLSSKQLPLLSDPNRRFILECGHLPPQLIGNVPILMVGESHQETWAASFSLAEVVALSAVAQEMPGFSSKLFRDRVSRLSSLIQDASLPQIVLFVLESLSLEEDVRKQCKTTLQKNYPGYVSPPRLTWETTLDALLKCGYIPFVSSQHGRSTMSQKIIAHLERKELVTIEVNLNSASCKQDIEDLLRRCELLGGEKNVVFCLKDFHLSPLCVQDYLRLSRRDPVRRFFVTSWTSLDTYPERLRRFLFVLKKPSTSREPDFPLEAYENVIGTSSGDVKVKDVRDAVRYEICESLSELSKLYKEYARVKRDLSTGLKPTSRMARGKGLFDVNEMVTIYQQLQTERRRGCLLDTEPVVTDHSARRLSFLEKSLGTPGCSVLVSTDLKRDDSLYWINFVAQMLNLEQVQSASGTLFDSDIHQALRLCLLEDRPVLLTAESTDASIPYLHSLIVSKSLPPTFLSQQLITEFCEKHTVEGRGVWKRIALALSNLRVCFLLPKDHFPTFYSENKEITELSLIEMPPAPTSQSVLSAVSTIVSRSGIFSEPQGGEDFRKKIEQVPCGEDEDDRTELARLFVHIAQARRGAVKKVMNRYERGMEKLRLAEEQTGSLQAELSRLRPELLRTSIETSILMSSIERETIEVENAREVVAANEAKANFAAQAAQALRAESEADLANAIPALESAVEALETLNQSDVSTLKTMRFPPYGVRICMEAVCILLGEAPARVPNPDGGFATDYWPKGLKMLSDIHFLSRIRNFPRDSVSRKTMSIIRDRYLSKPEFDPEHIKQCSLAAEGLCLWIKAIEFYHRISRIVEPKKEKLRQAELLVKTHLKQLEVKRKALQRVTEKLQQLSDQFGQMSQRKQDLQTQIATCEARIERAERLVDALEGEKEKWLRKMESIREDLRQLPQHCLIAAMALQRHSREMQPERRRLLAVLEEGLFPETKEPTDIGNEHLINLCSLPFLLYNDYGRGWKTVSRHFPQAIKLTKLDEAALRLHVSTGSVLVVQDHKALRELIQSIEFGSKEDNRLAVVAGEELEVGEGFRLFVSSPCPELDQWKFVSLNMEYSQEELRDEIFVRLGRSNWSEVQRASDTARAAVKEDVRLLDELETKMLELLGNKEEDLDDEGAVTLLGITHETQSRLKDKERELENAEQKLHSEKDKFIRVVEWATDAILMVRRFRELDLFSNINVEELIDLTDTKVADEDLVPMAVPSLWKLFWNFASLPMVPEQRRLLHAGLHLLHLQKTFSRNDIELLQSGWEEPDQPKTLGKVLSAVNCRTAILVQLSEPRCEIAAVVKDVARGSPVQWTSFPEHALQNIEQYADSAMWLGITLSEWGELHKVEDIRTALNTLPTVHPSFRLIVAISATGEAQPESLLYSHRICISSPTSLRGLLAQTVSSPTFRQFFHSALLSKRSNAIRLVVFHFAIRTRLTGIGDLELRMALTLFKESNCDEEKELEELFLKVIATVYIPRGRNVMERSMMKAIFRWIYHGLNKVDDSLIRQYISGQLDEEALLGKLKRVDDANFSGRCTKMTKSVDQKALLKTEESLHFLLGFGPKPALKVEKLQVQTRQMFGGGSAPTWINLIKDEISLAEGNRLTRHDYWASLLGKETINEVDARYLHSPHRIIAFLAFKYAQTNRVPIDEIVVMGHTEWSRKNVSANSLILQKCSACNVRVDNFELKEQEMEEGQLVDLVLEAGKRRLDEAKQEKTLPLLDREGQLLCDVHVRTNITMSHWHLRGSHFSIE